MNTSQSRRRLWLGLALWLGALGLAQAQYFGRNKPVYESIDFQVLQSPHFELYHYLGKNPEYLRQFLSDAEQWYLLHQAVLLDTFEQPNPFVLYNDHADFQQTNTIGGQVGVGTGGVTEGLKNRVVMPIAMSRQQTHHVLGHELVHAFQYHLLINGDSTSLRSIANLPLWMVEGLAEYLSIGNVDAHTAMWMRDAVMHDKLPGIKDLDDPKYFPYRWGQAFWAYVTGVYGDGVIRPLFENTAKYGLEAGIALTLRSDLESLSTAWQNALISYYGGYLRGQKSERFVGKKLISSENAGRLNISPAISPDGRYVIFLSEKNLFSVDLFLANARTGEIIRRVASSTRDGHIDDFDYIESAGTWSPDGERFAFTAYSKGRQILIITEVESGRKEAEFAVEGLPAFSNPAWSPDGQRIVVTGLKNGQTDLFAIDLKSRRAEQLTNDPYAELHPDFSADGQRLVFATDRLASERGRVRGKWTFNLAVMDMSLGYVDQIDVLFGADNLNPVFDNEDNIVFLSNRDGFRNLYKYDTRSKELFQLSDFLLGVSGITPFAPAISVARKRDRLLFTHYTDGEYHIYQTDLAELPARPILPDAIDMGAATLPPAAGRRDDVVNANLAQFDQLDELSPSQIKRLPYRPKFQLDYIGGSTGMGVATTTNFGNTTGLAGGIDMLFSDILGNNQLYAGLAMNGEIYDVAGQFSYVNRKQRINWGLSFSHIPFRNSGIGYGGIDTLFTGPNTGVLVDKYFIDQRRLFEDRLGAFAFLPLSRTLRLEAGGSYAFYYYRTERFTNYYDGFGRLLLQERQRLESPPGFQMANVNAAVVGDRSFFGMTAPIKGERYRLGGEAYFGAFNFYTLTADYRQYIYARPFTFAFRGMHLGRYGRDANAFFPLFVGDMIFVRGYGFRSIEQTAFENGFSVNQLIGSKVLLGNAEIRLPFTGPKALGALFDSRFLLSDLALFFDAGVAYDELSEINSGEAGLVADTALPIFSAGASLRINLFGALIVEPYFAWPLQENTRAIFGLNLMPGW